MSCGCSGVMRATTALQPQLIYFCKCCKTNGFSNILRERNTEQAWDPWTSLLSARTPTVRDLLGEFCVDYESAVKTQCSKITL